MSNEYLVTGQTAGIQFGLDTVAEILQNVRTIITTQRGSVPLDREFGVEMLFLDSPTPTAQALLTADVVESVEKYEPRVTVSEVSFIDDQVAAMNGRLFPSVKIKIKDGII